PASVGQASLWFLRQIMPVKTAYNLGVQLELDGELDAEALAAAFREVVRRHDSLRTTFTLVAGRPMQAVHRDPAADVAVADAPAPRRAAEELAAAPFDLERGPLVRARVLRRGPGAHTLVVVVDHIIADGVSLGIVWGELEALYRKLPLPPPRRQFAR